MGETRNIALLGQPNSGKSTIFNTLTGMHQHVGNWPGKTVEKKEGEFKYGEASYKVADLPGSYSLSANSEEEMVTRDYIAKNDLDLVCILADASQLERSMYMPPYHKPRWGFILKNSLMRMWEVFKKAFAIELIVCIIFYILSYSSSGIEGSILYKVGTFVEPVSSFIGMKWQTFMAFIAAMISKEAVLGVLSALFANSGSIMDSTTGLAAASDNIAQIVASAIPKAEALAFIIAVTFNIPCLQAVVSTYNETHSVKWTAKIGLYYILTALLLSTVVYHVAALFM